MVYPNLSSGLGVGTTPTALMAHDIQTTIVEIDPVVVDFARKYFDLPSPTHMVIQDAVSYATELVKQGNQYDYIVHDVFTGGAEPVELFTYEFLSDLYTLLRPGGVIAIVGCIALIISTTNMPPRIMLAIYFFHHTTSQWQPHTPCFHEIAVASFVKQKLQPPR